MSYLRNIIYSENELMHKKILIYKDNRIEIVWSFSDYFGVDIAQRLIEKDDSNE